MDGVTDLLRIFGDERYMLAYTEKKRKRRADSAEGSGGDGSVAPRGIVSVILHRDATGADTVKSLLALEYLQDELKRAGFKVAGAPRSVSKTTAKAVNGDAAAAGAGATVAAAAATAAATPGVSSPPGSGVVGWVKQPPGGVAGAPPVSAGGGGEERRHP